MRKTILLLASLLFCSAAVAQSVGGISVKPYGFVRTYLNTDSRKTYTVLGGEYNMLPLDRAMNADSSADLNAVAHWQLQALTSRIGLDVQGAQLGAMATQARIEVDFGGFGSNNTVLRLRLAYLTLTAGSGNHFRQYTIGQDWHPMSGSIMPEVVGMAAGAPFRPHSRTPQVRLHWRMGSVGLTAALLGQLQFASSGPTSATDPSPTSSTQFIANALCPEAFLGISLHTGGFYGQVGADALVLRPRTHASVGGVVRPVNEQVSSLSPTIYAQYTAQHFSIKARTMLASNTSHLNQMVGYGVTAVDADGTQHYSPLHASITYVDIATRGNTPWRANLFVGYMKNLGSSQPLYRYADGSYRLYQKGQGVVDNINSAWRIAPSVTYTIGTLCFGLEYEATAATYSRLTSTGSVSNDSHLHQVVSHRLCAMVRYGF